MSSDLQRRAEEMFVQAVEMPEGERTRFINLQCAGDDPANGAQAVQFILMRDRHPGSHREKERPRCHTTKR